jgi:hypothetical protein
MENLSLPSFPPPHHALLPLMTSSPTSKGSCCGEVDLDRLPNPRSKIRVDLQRK